MSNFSNSNRNKCGLPSDFNPQVTSQTNDAEHLINLKNASDKPPNLNLQKENSIAKIDKKLWNSFFDNCGIHNWDGLHLLERTFTNNELPEHNWKFHYYLLIDEERQPVAATFFTQCLVKDDFVSPKSVSEIIEKERELSPYYMTTKSLMMGTPLFAGSHLYINRNYKNWKQALGLLLEEVDMDRRSTGIEQIILRDFNICDFEIRNALSLQGYIKLQMPSIGTITDVNWKNSGELLKSLSIRNQLRLAKEVLQYRNYYDIEYLACQNISEQTIDYLYKLYKQFKDYNLTVNTFGLPKKYFKLALRNQNWETILLHLKEHRRDSDQWTPVAMALCYKGENNYIPCCFGIDNNYRYTHSNFSQINYQCILRAGQLNKKTLQFGYTTDTEKEMFEARAIPHVMYIQATNMFREYELLSNTFSENI